MSDIDEAEEQTTQTTTTTGPVSASVNLKIFLIVLFVVFLLAIIGYFFIYSSGVVTTTPMGTYAGATGMSRGGGAIGPSYAAPPATVVAPAPTVVAAQPTTAVITTPTIATGPASVTIVQSPGPNADLQSILAYLYQRGKDVLGIPWSPEIISTFANIQNWQAQTTTPPSFLYASGVTTNASYYLYYDDVSGSWSIRPVQTTYGQAVGGSYQTISSALYQPSGIRFA